METPSSTRRVTRSQTLMTANSSNNIPLSKKIEESEKSVKKSRQQQQSGKQQERSALIDITNDSPIGGLAMGSLETPSSTMSKKRSNSRGRHSTPCSGEALLRGQVKTLLQKVEEEAKLSKLSWENRPLFNLQGLVSSPIGLVAPTPANTPHVLDLYGGEEGFRKHCLALVTPSPVQEHLKISQMVSEIFDGKRQVGVESDKNVITRSLLMDFSEKSEGCESRECSSVLTCEGGESGSKEKSSLTDDDSASVWSMQLNASVREEEEDVDDDGDRVEEIGEEEEEEGEGDDGLCEVMSKMSVNGFNGEKTVAKFRGKHTRFVYNSEDEIEVEGEEECYYGKGNEEEASAVVLRLKGLPTTKGKHVRFPEESEEDDL